MAKAFCEVSHYYLSNILIVMKFSTSCSVVLIVVSFNDPIFTFLSSFISKSNLNSFCRVIYFFFLKICDLAFENQFETYKPPVIDSDVSKVLEDLRYKSDRVSGCTVDIDDSGVQNFAILLDDNSQPKFAE